MVTSSEASGNGYAVIGATLILLTSALGLGAQTLDTADGVTFDDRFFIDGQIAPTFTRPEVIELFPIRTLTGNETVASDASRNDAYKPGPLAQIIFPEPKGPAKVLKDLLNTPVKELLVSRAEAGPEAPPPQQGGNDAPQGPASVLARAADPLSERPTNADVASMPAPTSAQSIREGAVAPEGNTDPHHATAHAAQELTAARATPAQTETAQVEVPPDRTGSSREGTPGSAAPWLDARDATPEGERSTTARLSSTKPLKEGRRRIARGRATWYQHPGRTASGEKFDPNQRTAAHHTLPFGSHVRVVNEQTDRSVVVRINDRIPRKAKVLIDLSRGSARAIGLVGTGTVSLYEVRVPEQGSSAQAPGHSLAPPRHAEATTSRHVGSSERNLGASAKRAKTQAIAQTTARSRVGAQVRIAMNGTRGSRARQTRLHHAELEYWHRPSLSSEAFVSRHTYRAAVPLQLPEGLKPTFAP